MLFLPGNVSMCLQAPYRDANRSLRRLGRPHSPGSSGLPGLRLMPEFLPDAAAPHASRPLRHDVRPGTRRLIADLDQDPAPLAGPGQREAPGQLAAVQHEGDVPGLVPDHLGGPLVPDDHRAAPARLTLMYALELTGRQGV